jgi:oligoribonuclease
MIVWTDVESSSLDERTGHLLEVALVVTDDDLNEVAATSIVVRPVGIDVDAIEMDDVVREMHSKNGLLDELRANGGLRRHEAELALVAFVEGVFKDVPTYALSQTPLAGSNVGFDRRWLRAHAPALEELFSYRSIDVSSLTELAERWTLEIYSLRPKAGEAHRALADVRESIACLKYYRDVGFIGRRLWNKVRALEEVALDIFDDLTGHSDYRVDESRDLPINDSYVSVLAVALHSVEPKTQRTSSHRDAAKIPHFDDPYASARKVSDAELSAPTHQHFCLDPACASCAVLRRCPCESAQKTSDDGATCVLSEFEIWCEGFASTGQGGRAQLLGIVRAVSFQDACDSYFEHYSSGQGKLYDATKRTYWGCGLFDNEVDARKAFG